MQTVPAKNIVTRTKSSEWFGADYNMNLYRGCSHGCIYCDSRSECYHIDDFDTVRVKENALELVRNDLKRKIRPGVVATGAMSDPYNPFEKELLLTRHALELLGAFGFGAAIATKSPLVARDADVLAEIKAQAPVIVKVTVTTADDALCRKVEPFVAPSSERLSAVERLSALGIFCGLLLMPVLPFLEDTPENVLELVRLAKESGARFLYAAFGMTLRQNQRLWYYNQLDSRFPGSGLRSRYEARYGERYNCASPRARELYTLFSNACNQAGLLYRMPDIIRAYKQGYGEQQLTFF